MWFLQFCWDDFDIAMVALADYSDLYHPFDIIFTILTTITFCSYVGICYPCKWYHFLCNLFQNLSFGSALKPNFCFTSLVLVNKSHLASLPVRFVKTFFLSGCQYCLLSLYICPQFCACLLSTLFEFYFEPQGKQYANLPLWNTE